MRIISKIYSRLNRIADSWISKTRWYNETLQFEGCRKILSNCVFNIDIANLGSSSSYYAFDYSSVGVKGINLATPRQPLKADREMIRNYFSYLHDGSVVLIPLCLFSALVGEDEELPDKYYVLLHNESIPHFSWKKKIQVLDMYNKPIKLFPCYSLMHEFRGLLRPKKKTLTKVQFEIDAEGWIQNWKHEFSIVDFNKELSLKNADSYESAVNLLQEIIGFCNSRNLKPVLIFPPVSKYLAECIDKRMQSLLIDEFVNKANILKIPFLNYLNDNRFADDGYYQNAFLLNEKGASVFTKQVVSDLRNMNYL